MFERIGLKCLLRHQNCKLQRDLYSLLGITKQRFFQKLQREEFSIEEINKIAAFFNLKPEKIAYFEQIRLPVRKRTKRI